MCYVLLEYCCVLCVQFFLSFVPCFVLGELHCVLCVLSFVCYIACCVLSLVSYIACCVLSLVSYIVCCVYGCVKSSYLLLLLAFCVRRVSANTVGHKPLGHGHRETETKAG